MTSMRLDGFVEFRFFRPDVSSVNVVGDFNNWHHNQLTMQPQGGGWWVAAAHIPAGEYRFRYYADGQWFTDFASHGVAFENKTWNGILLVHEIHGISALSRPAA